VFLLFSILLGIVFCDFQLIPDGYFRDRGVDIMAFDDIYLEEHQASVSRMMNGLRIGSTGDVRLEHTPGQWSPVPITLSRIANLSSKSILTHLRFSDPSRHLTGFNHMIYPDIQFECNVAVAGRAAP
jgi:hypothetical protein